MSFEESFDSTISDDVPSWERDDHEDGEEFQGSPEVEEIPEETFSPPAFSFADNEDTATLKSGRLIYSAPNLLSAFTSDATHFYVSGLNSPQILVFSIVSMKLERVLEVSSDGQANREKSNKKTSSTLPRHRFPGFTCLSIFGSRLAAGTVDGEIFLLHAQTGEILSRAQNHKQSITKLECLIDPYDSTYCNEQFPLIYSSSLDGHFLVYSTLKGLLIHSYCLSTCPITCFLTIPGQWNIIFLGFYDGTIRKLNLKEQKCLLLIKSLSLKESPVRELRILPSPIGKKGGKGGKTSNNNSGKTPKSLTSPGPVASSSAGESSSGPGFSRPSLSCGQNPSDFPDDHVLLYISHGIGELKGLDTRTGIVFCEINNLSPESIGKFQLYGNRYYFGLENGEIRIDEKSSLMNLEILQGGSGNHHHHSHHHHHGNGRGKETYEEIMNSSSSSSSSSSVGSIVALHIFPELCGLLSLNLNGEIRLYDLNALEDSIGGKLAALEEGKTMAFEQWMQGKIKGKGKKGSKKGKAKKTASAAKKTPAVSAIAAAKAETPKAATGSVDPPAALAVESSETENLDNSATMEDSMEAEKTPAAAAMED